MEVQKIRAPGFMGGRQGHIDFVQTIVAGLMGIGLSFDQALLFTAHLARETGWGQYTWNNNFGNIKGQNPDTGNYYVLTDRLGFTDRYRAYSDVASGLGGAVGLIRDRPRYQGAWAKLLAVDPDWYSQLGIEGYYEGPLDPNQPGVHQPTTRANVGPAQAEYEDVLRLVRGYAGAAPSGVSGQGLAGLALIGIGLWAAYKFATSK